MLRKKPKNPELSVHFVEVAYGGQPETSTYSTILAMAQEARSIQLDRNRQAREWVEDTQNKWRSATAPSWDHGPVIQAMKNRVA